MRQAFVRQAHDDLVDARHSAESFFDRPGAERTIDGNIGARAVFPCRADNDCTREHRLRSRANDSAVDNERRTGINASGFSLHASEIVVSGFG